MKLHARLKKPDTPSDIVEMPAGVISLERPTIFYFAGGFTTEEPKKEVGDYPPLVKKFLDFLKQHVSDVDTLYGDFEKKARGYFNIVRKLLRYTDTPVMTPTYLVSYREAEECQRSIYAFNKDPMHFFSDDAAEFTTEVLLPHILETVEVERKDGEYRIAPSAVKKDLKALSNIKLLGHSYGTGFGFEVQNALRYFFDKLQLGADQQQAIMRRVQFVGVSNVTDIHDREGPSFQNIILQGTDDKAAAFYHDHLLRKLPKGHKGTSVVRNAAGDTIFFIDVQRDVINWKESAKGVNLEFINNDKAGHHSVFYFMRAVPTTLAPEIIERVLGNMVQGKGEDFPFDMLKAPSRRFSFSALSGISPDAIQLNGLLNQLQPSSTGMGK